MSGNDFKERIRRELPIESYISRFVDLKKAGKNYLGLCPFHQEKTPSFNVNPQGYYHCFGCKASGDIFRFVMDYHRVDFPRSMEILSEASGIPLEKNKSPQSADRDKKKEEGYRLNQKVSDFFKTSLFSEKGKSALGYLIQRGLTPEEIQKFDIGFAPEGFQNLKGNLLSSAWEEKLGIELGILKKNEKGNVYDFYRNRVMFPIRDGAGRIVGFSGRTLSDDPREAKYVNSPNSFIYDKSRQVYNLYLAQEEIRNLRFVYLVEGVMDAIGLFTRSVKNVVAPLGTSFTNSQARILKNLAERVVLVMDGDTAGEKGAIRASEILLQEGLECEIVLLRDGQDPFLASRNLSRPDLRNLLDSKENGWSFLTRSAILNANSESSPEDKKKAILSLFQFTKKWSKETDRQIFLNEGAKHIGISSSALMEDFLKEAEQFGHRFSDTTKREFRKAAVDRPIQRGAVECERTLLAKMILHPELFRWSQKIDDLEFLDYGSVVLWEWIYTQYHMGESLNPAEVLSSESLPDEIKEELAPFLMEEEDKEEEDIQELFEDLLMMQEIFFHEREMDNLLLNSEPELEPTEKISLMAKHKDEVQKRKEYFRKKSLVKR